MHRIMKLIVTHFLIFLLAFLGIQGYKIYQAFKIKHLLNVWKKKYHPFPTKKEPEYGSFLFLLDNSFGYIVCLFVNFICISSYKEFTIFI